MKKILLLFVVFVYVGCTDDASELLTQQSPEAAVQTRSGEMKYTSNTKDVCFGLSDKYDNGVYPDIAANSKQTFLEVHQSSYTTAKVWYHLGRADGMTVNWLSSVFLDTGYAPSVALNDNNFAVEVHRAPTMTASWELAKWGWLSYYKLNLSYKTWYHAGTISGDKVSWGGSVQYGEGEEPDVALNKNYCVEVHRSGSSLYYKVGTIDTKDKKVNFNAESRFADNYTNPKIAINGSNNVVVTYGNVLGKMCCKVGRIMDSKTIIWGAEMNLGLGGKCDVALADDESVVLVYTQGGKLYRKTGTLNALNSNVEWTNSGFFDEGTYKKEWLTLCNPTVAIAPDASLVVQAHTAFGYELKYSTSLLIDRMNWMSKADLGTKTMRQICLPGSHDAGTFNINGSSNRILYSDGANREKDLLNVVPVFAVAKFAKTQEKTMLEQLKSGIRYFDLRPYFKGTGDTIYAHHTLVGESFKVMLDDMRTFLNSTNGELVVIKLSAFNNFYKSNASNPGEVTFDQSHAVLGEMINRYLGNYIYRKDWAASTRFVDLTYNEIINNNRSSKVIVLYGYNCDSKAELRSKYGFFTVNDVDIYDDYSNTTYEDRMKLDQQRKMKDQTSSNKFNLLSWTLTINENQDEIVRAATSGDQGWISNQCNVGLARFTAEFGKKYRLNILYTDYSDRARTTDCAIMLNKNH